MFRTAPRLRLLPVVLAVLAAAALVTSCGDEQSSSTTAVAATGGSQDADEAPASTTPSTAGSSGSSGSTAGSGAGSGSVDPPTTTAGSDGPVGAAEQAVDEAFGAAPWASSITGVSISPGEELIVSISTGDEGLPALEVCEAARGALAGVDGGAAATINVWFAPDLAADGGDERVLATSLGGVECELVRPAE